MEKAKSLTVKIKFSPDQVGWIQSAADLLADGNVTDLVANCFWTEFERLSKEVAKQITKEESVQN